MYDKNRSRKNGARLDIPKPGNHNQADYDYDVDVVVINRP